MKGVVFVLDEICLDSLYLCILYVASHMVLAHQITLASSFELVSEKLLQKNQNEAPNWIKQKVDKIQCKLNENKFSYRAIRLEKQEGLLDEYDVKSDISMLMNTHANAKVRDLPQSEFVDSIFYKEN